MDESFSSFSDILSLYFLENNQVRRYRLGKPLHNVVIILYTKWPPRRTCMAHEYKKSVLTYTQRVFADVGHTCLILT